MWQSDGGITYRVGDLYKVWRVAEIDPRAAHRGSAVSSGIYSLAAIETSLLRQLEGAPASYKIIELVFTPVWTFIGDTEELVIRSQNIKPNNFEKIELLDVLTLRLELDHLARSMVNAKADETMVK